MSGYTAYVNGTKITGSLETYNGYIKLNNFTVSDDNSKLTSELPNNVVLNNASVEIPVQIDSNNIVKGTTISVGNYNIQGAA